MKTPLDASLVIPIAVLLVVLMLYVFDRVRADYRKFGKLTPRIALFQTGYFAVYAVASYAFLDARLAAIQVDAWYFPVAMVLLGFGLAIVLMSMPFLGRKSFGAVVGQLKTDGLYSYSRNPQLVGYILFIFGYALLWPSWQGMLWAALSLVIASLMVRGEEEHLRKVFGEKYREYCHRVPRFVGWKKADRSTTIRHRHHAH